MIISMQDVIFMLRLDIKMLDNNIRINVIKASSFFKKYNLNMTLHILMQYVNNLTVIIIIHKIHNSLNCAVYTIMIIYFKKLIKHFNAEEMISTIKTILFNNCFNE